MSDSIDHIAVFIAGIATLIAWYAYQQSSDALAVDEKRKKTITAIEQNDKLTSTLSMMHYKVELRFQEEKLAYASAPRQLPFFVSLELKNDAILVGNMIETWALYIETEMADEDLLFGTAGNLYCHMARELGSYAGLSSAEALEMWPPVYRLYTKWNARIESEAQPQPD